MSIKRDELFILLESYRSEINQQLKFCHDYLHFYITLLSLILGVTVGAIFDLNKLGYPFGLTLILGPIMVIFLAMYGYETIKVFYRRFIEAWITLLNIESMLGLVNYPLKLDEAVKQPLYPSKQDGSFIAQFERPIVRKILDTAEKESWPAEKLLEEVVKEGDTLKYALITLSAFSVVSLILAALVVFRVLSLR